MRALTRQFRRTARPTRPRAPLRSETACWLSPPPSSVPVQDDGRESSPLAVAARTDSPYVASHFVQWIAAIVLHHATGYLSLVSQYEFPTHRRKHEIVRELPSGRCRADPGRPDRARRTQAPDLVMYAADLSHGFSREVKGPRDRLRAEQLSKFAALAPIIRLTPASSVSLARMRAPSTQSDRKRETARPSDRAVPPHSTLSDPRHRRGRDRETAPCAWPWP